MLGEVLALHKAAWAVAALFLGAAAAGKELYRKTEGKSRAVWTAVLLFSVIFGYGRMEIEKQWIRDCLEPGLDGRSVWIEGTAGAVTEGTGLSGEGIRITLEGCRAVCTEEGEKGENGEKERKQQKERDIGRVEVFLDNRPEPAPWPGDRLEIYGELEACEGASNPGEFDFRMYYFGFRSCYRMYAEGGTGTYRQGMQNNPVRRVLFRIRNHGSQILDSLLPKEDAGVMKAMILGDKAGMDEEIKDLYQDNGIAHILAISGLHISLIGAGFYRLLRKMGAGFGPAASVGAAMLFLYGTMVGFSASSLRAVIMMTTFFLAEYLGRTYDMTSAAGLAGILIMIGRPFQIFHSGFQLSFGAVLSISLLGKYLEETIKPPKGILQQMTTGAAVQIGTCPIVLYHFYQYPIYGFFLNLAVIPLMTYAVISGILGIFLGSISFELGRAALGTCHYVLALYSFLCDLSAKLPMSNLILGRPSLWQIALYAAILRAGLYGITKAGRRKGAGLAVLCLILLAASHPGLRRLDGGLTVTFLDVGQGDGILVEKGETAILIDGGSTDEKKLGEQVLEPCLKSKGISEIDYAIVSHGDEDHISGLRYLLEEDCGIQVKNLALSVSGRGTDTQNELKSLMEKHSGKDKGNIWEMKAKDRIRASGLVFTCLYPEQTDQAGDTNQQSLVLLMSLGSLDVLFTGDTEEICEDQMTKRPFARELLKKADVLKTAHHGSDSSTGEAFLGAAENLKCAVISCGENNRYGHPSKEVVRRLEEKEIDIFITYQEGAVVLKGDEKGKFVIILSNYYIF